MVYSDGTETTKAPVEKKVTTATLASALTSLILGYILTQIPALAAWNDYLQIIVLGAVTGAITFVVGFWTKHTARNDAQTRQDRVSDPIPPTDV